jgi:hypothetical protein
MTLNTSKIKTPKVLEEIVVFVMFVRTKSTELLNFR